MKQLVAALAAIGLGLSGAAAAAPRVAIIIDDLGYRHSDGLRTVALPGAVTVAVLPGTPLGASLARAAHAADKEVIVHLPLEANVDDGLEEPGGIRLDTTRSAFRKAFDAAVDSVPHAVGLNNHRGSLLTRHPGHMRWLMEEIGRQNGWYFVDSFTTPRSIALHVAEEHGIPADRRDVFLDARKDRASIAREFERLKQIARRHGTAIGIGHPFPETLAFLEEALPTLEAEGIRLVPLSSIVLSPRPAVVAGQDDGYRQPGEPVLAGGL